MLVFLQPGELLGGFIVALYPVGYQTVNTLTGRFRRRCALS